MEEDLRAYLAAAVPLTTLIADRIQWDVRDELSPSVALHLISAPTDRHLTGETNLVLALVQADCWGETFLGAKAVGKALKAALPPRGLIVGSTKFLSCAVADTERGRFGDSPNILHRTRLDVRVTYQAA